jgi:hypothetical protein
MTKPIPDGYSTITASLIVKDASNAIEFNRKSHLEHKNFTDFLDQTAKL